MSPRFRNIFFIYSVLLIYTDGRLFVELIVRRWTVNIDTEKCQLSMLWWKPSYLLPLNISEVWMCIWYSSLLMPNWSSLWIYFRIISSSKILYEWSLLCISWNRSLLPISTDIHQRQICASILLLLLLYFSLGKVNVNYKWKKCRFITTCKAHNWHT